MSKISPLSGFPELLPAQRAVEREVIASVSRTFELHGFANIETRVVEPIERLAKGGEVDKEIYVLQRIAAEPDAKADLGLHFDLTVPFARYVLEHAGHLEFPFRRFQVQPAWRGERPQEGRYRQFTQADVDIVGRDELPFHHDVEVMSVMVDALGRLPIPRVSFQFNNRKLIQGFYRGLGIDDVTDAIRVIDKLDKLPADEVAAMLVERVGTTPEQAQRCLELATIRVEDTSFVEQVRALGVTDELLEEGLAELAAVVEGCRAVAGDRVGVEANLRIARGLDYYTGTVVEIFMEGLRAPEVGRRGRALRRARQRRTYDVPRRRRLLRGLAHAHPAHRRRRAVRQPARAQRRPRRPQHRGGPRGQHAGGRSPPRPRRRLRGRPGPGEVRQTDPLRRAPRDPLRLVRPG